MDRTLADGAETSCGSGKREDPDVAVERVADLVRGEGSGRYSRALPHPTPDRFTPFTRV